VIYKPPGSITGPQETPCHAFINLVTLSGEVHQATAYSVVTGSSRQKMPLGI
jgi:hypothetical protein